MPIQRRRAPNYGTERLTAWCFWELPDCIAIAPMRHRKGVAWLACHRGLSGNVAYVLRIGTLRIVAA